MRCPVCCMELDAEYVDIGVGWQRCTPYHCDTCGWYELDVHDAQNSYLGLDPLDAIHDEVPEWHPVFVAPDLWPDLGESDEPF